MRDSHRQDISKHILAIDAAKTPEHQEKAFLDLVAFVQETRRERDFNIVVLGFDAQLRNASQRMDLGGSEVRYIQVSSGVERATPPFRGTIVEVKSTNVVPMLRSKLQTYYDY